MEHEINYRYAVATDALRLSILFQTVYITTYGVDGVTNEFANFIVRRFSVNYIEDKIARYPQSLIVATYNGNLVGAAELNFDTVCSIGNIAAPELSKLYVLNLFVGKGIGYNLVKEVEKTIAAQGHKQLWLEVWQDNPHAIAFYARQGYKELGTVLFPMEDNTYTNCVMLKELNG